MSSFFDDDDDESIPTYRNHAAGAGPRGQGSRNAHASSSRLTDRESSIISNSSVGGSGSRSFLSRLESTVSPGRPSDRYSIGLDSVLRDENGYVNGLDGEDETGANGRLARVGNGKAAMDLDEDDEDLDDVRKLGRAWVKERGTVDIMPWAGDLIDSLFDKLEQQQKMVDTLKSDPQTSEEEHFKLMLVGTEMERVKFLIRSYVRTRLHKIEKYSQYIVATSALHNRLSGAELSHARRYAELLHTHFQHSVLDSLPEWLRGMDDTYGDGLSMVTKPSKDVPVLIFCRKDCGEITLEGGEAASLAKGTTHLVKYKLVERWISLGWAEVL